MKVLIVDDHILFRQGLVSLLKPEPVFEVVGEAGSVREAVDQAEKLRPELILLDLTLPDGSGLDAISPILEQLPNCNIVMLTIHDTDDALFEAIRKGAKGYLLKDVPITDLLASLKSLERGEPALSRCMTGRIILEFSRTARPTYANEIPDKLTPRELDVLRELATGATNREIADRLFLSENTVKHHVHNILGKLELENRRQAVQYARSRNLK